MANGWHSGGTGTLADWGENQGGQGGGYGSRGEDGAESKAYPSASRPRPKTDRSGRTPRHGSKVAGSVTQDALQGIVCACKLKLTQ